MTKNENNKKKREGRDKLKRNNSYKLNNNTSKHKNELDGKGLDKRTENP